MSKSEFGSFEIRKITPITPRIPVTEQIVCSKADKARWELEARAEELKWALSRTSIDELKERYHALQAQLIAGEVSPS